MRRLILSLFVSTCFVSVALACGIERWPVKTGADRDAGKVGTAPQTTTITELTDLHVPPNPKSRNNSRFPAELKTYQIKGVLTLIKKEADEDYHIVVADPADEELTMIVESVSPNCTKGSRFTQEIKNVRNALDQKFGTVGKKKKTNLKIPVTVMGIGFFDPIHGQEGVAPNGVELHPILEITFN
jgi:hypothetical protein